MKENTIQNTVDWFVEAVKEPTDKNRVVQLGVHIEEFAEMMDAIGCAQPSSQMSDLANSFKKSAVGITDLKIDRQELLDSLADQIVTACGVAQLFGMDIVGALNEVNRSNWSKFEAGKALFDENGKIRKGANYSKPNLEPFVWASQK